MTGPGNSGRQLFGCRKPYDVRVREAFNAFYQQLGGTTVRILGVEVALDAGSLDALVFALTDLNCAWTLLDARLELLEVSTNECADATFWNAPAMVLARSAMRGVITRGAAFAAQQDTDASRVLGLLDRLSSTLMVHEQIASAIGQLDATSIQPTAHRLPDRSARRRRGRTRSLATYLQPELRRGARIQFRIEAL